VIEVNGKVTTQVAHLFGESPKWTSNLQLWGETGAVTVRKDSNSKTSDKGAMMMFVGYGECKNDSIQMWDPKNHESPRCGMSFG
jgi:hypothetical protein